MSVGLGGAGGRWQKADRLNHEWWKDDGDNGGKVDRQGGPLADNRPETEDRKKHKSEGYRRRE